MAWSIPAIQLISGKVLGAGKSIHRRHIKAESSSTKNKKKIALFVFVGGERDWKMGEEPEE